MLVFNSMTQIIDAVNPKFTEFPYIKQNITQFQEGYQNEFHHLFSMPIDYHHCY